MFMAPFVLGALICYPEWMVLPALFVGVITFLFYQILTGRIEGWRDYRAGVEFGWVGLLMLWESVEFEFCRWGLDPGFWGGGRGRQV